MPKYCDSVELETIWGNWGYACMTPDLEPLRKRRLLYRQVIGSCIVYCVASTKPFFFGFFDRQDDYAAIVESSIGLDADQALVSGLIRNNFVLDQPAHISWEKLTTMIYAMCNGIALNFNPTSDEEKADLAHEAFKHTLDKIKRGKLKFTPGRAPVFNLLTTAIMRIMCSIKNKEKRGRTNQAKLTAEISSKVNLPKLRSLNIASSV